MQVTQESSTSATMHFQQADSRTKNVTPEPKFGYTTHIVWPFLIQVSQSIFETNLKQILLIIIIKKNR